MPTVLRSPEPHRSVDTPLKWHGGKSYLARRIIEQFPSRETWCHYVEPYFGGGSVLLANDPEGISEVANDLYANLTTFWRVLQDDVLFSRLVRLAQSTPFSEAEWNIALTDQVEYRSIPGFDGYRAGTDGSIWTCWRRRSDGWRYGTKPEMGTEWRQLTAYQSSKGYLRYTLVRNGEKRLVGGHILVLEAFVGLRPEGREACHNDGNPGNNKLNNLRWDTHSANEKDKSLHRSEVWRAWQFFIKCRQSLAGRMKNFAPRSRTRLRKNMNEQVSAWLSAIEGLPTVHARLKRVLILNRPALDVIKAEDGERTVFYLDPPYLHETRSTTGEFGEFEMTAAEHEDLLRALTGIRGRFLLSGYWSALYDRFATECGWRRMEYDLPNNAAGGETKERKVECLWMNYDEEGERL